MGSRISEKGRLYVNGNRIVFVSSGSDCPRINIAGETAKFRDDFSKGFKTSKGIAKLIF
ncbi:MAG: hypothetical protein M1360_03160 [Candidatus Marsarchaeota archaeon]|jgi:hypothetical protein|nr:hypothetical protein [Candidatus Marsarchaeota archaeon]MCL5418913.1 hypothetical protein [Candidatus Marsarchaeota archaeon]